MFEPSLYGPDPPHFLAAPSLATVAARKHCQSPRMKARFARWQYFDFDFDFAAAPKQRWLRFPSLNLGAFCVDALGRLFTLCRLFKSLDSF
jgi:hypothetical protein